MAQVNHAERITVVVTPDSVNPGQMIQIAAAVTDKFGTPIVTKSLYMEIVDSKGVVYWKLATIERNVSAFAKLIATGELKHNTRYWVRISPSRKLSPMGTATFKTKKRIIPLGIIPALMVTGILIPKNALIPEAAKVPVIATYTTELDGRVCPICKPLQGRMFDVNDPNIIRIGPSSLGGATHWGCRCHYNLTRAVNAATAKIERMLKSIKVVQMVKAVKKHKAMQERY